MSNKNLSTLGSHFNEHLLASNLEKCFYICLLLRQRLSKSHIILINFIQIKKNTKKSIIGNYKATCESIYKLFTYFSIRGLNSIFNFLNICYYMPKNEPTIPATRQCTKSMEVYADKAQNIKSAYHCT